ncbi:hypothetical protein IE81DRAFT_325200 [Ceraceosorus guamensis]|uniref:Uncharacterized protein n=1 Tax=Ceraceosorus guamensis TaxID=1522189 RepID=A0A316VUA1_9BASI|nr:hypothetical protein IE81DRAFT_325200 [Ceraceosorus guamensis]PWN40814.1 hypothetical protein IE81DRAFT_325200 [Ceraceosorus guamensis]
MIVLARDWQISNLPVQGGTHSHLYHPLPDHIVQAGRLWSFQSDVSILARHEISCTTNTKSQISHRRSLFHRVFINMFPLALFCLLMVIAMGTRWVHPLPVRH